MTRITECLMSGAAAAAVALQWPNLADRGVSGGHGRGGGRRAGTPVSYAGVARRSTVGVGAPGVGVTPGSRSRVRRRSA